MPRNLKTLISNIIILNKAPSAGHMTDLYSSLTTAAACKSGYKEG